MDAPVFFFALNLQLNRQGLGFATCSYINDMQQVKFQSSPAPKGGRYDTFARRMHQGHAFQSSPAPKGGRYDRVGLHNAYHIGFQSSPAPKGGRYIRLRKC